MDLLKRISETVEGSYRSSQRLLSYHAYLELVREDPTRHLRNAAQYLRDVFDHYGEQDVELPTGTVRRFKLFDAPWDGGRGRLVGQEAVQNALYRSLTNFVRQGRVDRLVLLHGPNGSAKSTITEMLARGMEDYSATDQGALYRFNWIFPTQRLERGGIGFGGKERDATLDLETFAHLDEDQVDAKLPCQLHDHPLLVVPVPERHALIDQLLGPEAERDPAFKLSDYIARGNLCPRCKLVFDALLASYGGDYLKVLRHVQVERFYVSRRYRRASARVEPKLATDAHMRQVTGDRNLSALPVALQNIPLFEFDGDLVQANRGVIDFADMLKRPPEAYKYLIGTVEEGRVTVERSELHFDLVFVGSSNELHLAAFKESPDWTSFKGRMELVTVPYLRHFRREQEIYGQQLDLTALGMHVAPFAVPLVSLWAVLSRLLQPDAQRFAENTRELVQRITPLEKARMFDEGRLPDWARGESRKLLRSALSCLHREHEADQVYEGAMGASPRELRGVIQNAAQRPGATCVTHGAVLDELRELVRDVSVYAFLRVKPSGGYHEYAAFIDQVRTWYLDQADDVVRGASGLVEAQSHTELFGRYVTHVTHELRGEKLRNPVTGALEDPDQGLMRHVEDELGVTDDRRGFRESLVSRIGAWSVDHAGDRPDYERIFPNHVRSLRGAYFTRQRARLSRLLRNALRVLDEEAAGLPADEAEEADGLVTRLRGEHGFCPVCARETLAILLRERYEG